MKDQPVTLETIDKDLKAMRLDIKTMRADMATKDDLKPLATKDNLKELKDIILTDSNKMTEIQISLTEGLFAELRTDIAVLDKNVSKGADKKVSKEIYYEDQEEIRKRVTRLEKAELKRS